MYEVIFSDVVATLYYKRFVISPPNHTKRKCEATNFINFIKNNNNKKQRMECGREGLLCQPLYAKLILEEFGSQKKGGVGGNEWGRG